MAFTATVLSPDADTQATVDNTWSGNETIALQVTDGDGTEWYDYTVDDKGNLSGEYYWTKPSPITVQGICPNIMAGNNDRTWSVEEDQSSDADYQSGDLLCSESKTVSFAQTPALTFYHQTANFATYEALVIPQDMAADTKLLTFTAEKDGTGYGPFYYTLQKDAVWKPGHVYTCDITIFHYGLDVQVSESPKWNTGTGGEGFVTLP